MNPVVNPRLFSFIGGRDGAWKVTGSRVIAGEGLPSVERIDVVPGDIAAPPSSDGWVLRGATSNERYVTRPEKEQLAAAQQGPARAPFALAVLIPIKKNDRWWALTQDERRGIFEERSGHTRNGMELAPTITRRLHHCRDLSRPEPFDFVTWFELGHGDVAAFDLLLGRLRGSLEWTYVEREVEIRLQRC